MTPKKHTFPTMHDDLTISFKQTPRKPVCFSARPPARRKKKVTKKMLSKAIQELFERSRHQRTEKGAAIPTTDVQQAVKNADSSAPSKPLPCTDLEAMLEECDKLAGRNYWPVHVFFYNIPQDGFVARSEWKPLNKLKDIEGFGKTRREAVENLLKKLRSVKK